MAGATAPGEQDHGRGEGEHRADGSKHRRRDALVLARRPHRARISEGWSSTKTWRDIARRL